MVTYYNDNNQNPFVVPWLNYLLQWQQSTPFLCNSSPITMAIIKPPFYAMAHLLHWQQSKLFCCAMVHLPLTMKTIKTILLCHGSLTFYNDNNQNNCVVWWFTHILQWQELKNHCAVPSFAHLLKWQQSKRFLVCHGWPTFYNITMITIKTCVVSWFTYFYNDKNQNHCAEPWFKYILQWQQSKPFCCDMVHIPFTITTINIMLVLYPTVCNEIYGKRVHY